MESTVPWIVWAFPIAFAIHNIEEALWFPAFTMNAGKFHKPVGRFEFIFALVPITLLAVVVTLLLMYTGKESVASYLFFAFNFGMFINVFFPHLVATIVLRRYCPGLLTGLVFLVPTTLYLLQFGYENSYFLFPMFWYVTIPFASVIIGAIPVLFKMGKWLQVRFASLH